MKIWKAIAECFGWRESEADKYEQSELERKICKGELGDPSAKYVSIAREIGNLEGLLRWLNVKDFNCDHLLSLDEIGAIRLIVRNAIDSRTVKKEKADEKSNT